MYVCEEKGGGGENEWRLRKKKKKGDSVSGRRIEKSHLSVHIFSFVQYSRRNHPEGRKIMTIYKLTV